MKGKTMARILGVSLVTYKRRERNIFSPDYETLGKIADYFHVATDYLLGRVTPNQLTPADRENLTAVAEAITDILAKTKYRKMKTTMKADTRKNREIASPN
jgi:transcriptional regulator with XRE-family HTH domain